jgi:hypothetical protein
VIRRHVFFDNGGPASGLDGRYQRNGVALDEIVTVKNQKTSIR